MKLVEKEIKHPKHPNHRLNLEYTEEPFKCDGCDEAGIGLKYTCTQGCDFDLHKACGSGPTTLVNPLYPKCEFKLYHQPPGLVSRICDACQKDVTGFVYHCRTCGYDLHPCCATLPQRLEEGETATFNLTTTLARPCNRCGNKGRGWSYRSECRRYNLHVGCVKEMLVERWEAMHLNLDKSRRMEVEAMIPGNVRGMMMMKGGEGRKGKKNVRRYCEIAGGVISVVVAAILGDPTPVITAVVERFVK